MEVETGMITDITEWISFEYLKLRKTLALFEYPIGHLTLNVLSKSE